MLTCVGSPGLLPRGPWARSTRLCGSPFPVVRGLAVLASPGGAGALAVRPFRFPGQPSAHQLWSSPCLCSRLNRCVGRLWGSDRLGAVRTSYGLPVPVLALKWNAGGCGEVRGLVAWFPLGALSPRVLALPPWLCRRCPTHPGSGGCGRASSALVCIGVVRRSRSHACPRASGRFLAVGCVVLEVPVLEWRLHPSLLPSGLPISPSGAGSGFLSPPAVLSGVPSTLAVSCPA